MANGESILRPMAVPHVARAESPLLDRIHEWIVTVDHKRLGMMYIGLALVFPSTAQATTEVEYMTADLSRVPKEEPDFQDEEQVVIADSFPSPDMCIWEYTVFKNEVLAIIDQAERSSGP